MIHDAITHRRSFNVIHLDTMLKVDVFVLKQEPYDQTAFHRARAGNSEQQPGSMPFILAQPEDVVLHKLLLYRMSDDVSERQWMDVLGVLKVRGDALDLGYMQHWAETLDVTDLLQRALQEAGLPE